MKKEFLDRMYKQAPEYAECSELTLPMKMISDYIINNSKYVYENLGLTRGEIDVLFTLYSFKKAVTASQIYEGLVFSGGGLSKVIKKLEYKGLISRQTSKEDKRSSLIYIEEMGKELILQCIPEFEKYENKIYSVLDDTEKDIIEKALKKILYSLVDE